MAHRFYIVRDGQKAYYASVEAVRKAAQRLANELGRKVPVHSEPGPLTRAVGGKPARLGVINQAGIYSRNPKARGGGYYMAYVREDGEWGPQFGDRDKETVDYEVQDWKDHGTKAKDIKVVRFARMPTNAQIEECRRAL